jgi:hypothetical protein
MAHYAVLDENDFVINVIKGRDETENKNWEEYYSMVFGKKCLRTSFNTYAGEHKLGGIPFRKNYASIGGSYDKNLDAFIPEKPYESWILDENTCIWVAPLPMPPSPNGEVWEWDEETLKWNEINIVE